MKILQIVCFVIVTAMISSCGINDLEDRVDKLESTIGLSEPMDVDFKTTNFDGIDVVKKGQFVFKGSNYYCSYITDYGDSTYYVYVERLADVDWDEDAWIEFDYDGKTKEVSNESLGIYFYDKFRSRISPTFDPDYTGNTVEIKVNSIDLKNGSVNVTATGSTTAASTNNEYSEKPMSLSLKFSGKVEIFKSGAK